MLRAFGLTFKLSMICQYVIVNSALAVMAAVTATRHVPRCIQQPTASSAAATIAPTISPTLGARNAVLTALEVGRATLNRGADSAITNICGYTIFVTKPAIKPIATAPAPMAAARRGQPRLNFAAVMQRAVPATTVATKNDSGI